MKIDITLSNDALAKLKQLFSDVKPKEDDADVFSAYVGKILKSAKEAR